MTAAPVVHTGQTTASARRALLAVLCGVQFMLVVGDTAVTIALPELRDGLDMSPSGLGWVVNGYVVAFGGLLMVAGRVGDRFGRVRTFTAGTVLFGSASIGCALAQEGWQLITFRVAQGVGAALIAPCVLALLTVIFTDPAELAKAFAVWGTAATTGVFAGLLLSGLLTGLISWRVVFVFNLPVVLVALAILPRMARAYQVSRPQVRIGPVPAVLLTLAVSGVVYALLAIPEHGTRSTAVLGTAGGAVLAGAGFVWWQLRSSTPLIPRGLLTNLRRDSALLVGLLVTASSFGIFFSLTLMIQGRWNYDPVETALVMAPFGLGSVAGIWLGQRAARVYSSATVLVGTTGAAVVGAVLLAIAGESAHYAVIMVGVTVFWGGVAGSMPHIVQLAVHGVREEQTGIAGSVVNSGQQLGGATGVAVAGALLGATADRFGTALIGAAVMAALACGFALIARLARTPTPEPPPETAAELTSVLPPLYPGVPPLTYRPWGAGGRNPWFAG